MNKACRVRERPIPCEKNEEEGEPKRRGGGGAGRDGERETETETRREEDRERGEESEPDRLTSRERATRRSDRVTDMGVCWPHTPQEQVSQTNLVQSHLQWLRSSNLVQSHLRWLRSSPESEPAQHLPHRRLLSLSLSPPRALPPLASVSFHVHRCCCSTHTLASHPQPRAAS